MPPVSSVPEVAAVTGLGQRFRYWRGRSGRRYLFTRIGGAEMPLFDGAVMLMERDGEIVFVGEGIAPSARASDELFVHLLATSESDRRLVVLDLEREGREAGNRPRSDARCPSVLHS